MIDSRSKVGVISLLVISVNQLNTYDNKIRRISKQTKRCWMGLCNSSYSTFCRAILCHYPQNYYAIIVRFFGNLAIGFTYGVIVAIVNPNYDEKKLENS